MNTMLSYTYRERYVTLFTKNRSKGRSVNIAIVRRMNVRTTSAEMQTRRRSALRVVEYPVKADHQQRCGDRRDESVRLTG
jgi:hypothetical protein